jgi:hypothetical protein
MILLYFFLKVEAFVYVILSKAIEITFCESFYMNKKNLLAISTFSFFFLLYNAEEGQGSSLRKTTQENFVLVYETDEEDTGQSELAPFITQPGEPRFIPETPPPVDTKNK